MPFDPSTLPLVEEQPAQFDPSQFELVSEGTKEAQPVSQYDPEKNKPMPFYEAQRKASAELAALTPEARQEMQTPLVKIPDMVPWQADLVLKAAQKMGVPGAKAAEDVMRGVSAPAKSMIESATSPVGIAMAPAFIGAPELMGPMMSVQSAPGILEGIKEIEEGVKEGDLQKTVSGAANTAFTTAITAVGPLGLFAKTRSARGVEQPNVSPVLPVAEATFQELIPESRRLPAPRTRMPEFQEGIIGPEPRTVAPISRQLPSPRTRMHEFTQSTLEPEGAPPRALPAPGETVGSILLPESPLGPREEGYRIQLPIEPESAKIAREQWSRPPIDIEAQVVGADALRQLVDITEETKTPGQPYKPPTVNVDLRQLERMMQKNTVSKVESWADQVIKDKLGGTSANPFFDPEFLAAAGVKGAILFKRGVVKFADWANEMRKQFGPGLDAHLPTIFEQSKNHWEQRAKEVSNASEVGQAATLHGNVLRVGEEARQAKEGLPVEEGGAGVRTEKITPEEWEELTRPTLQNELRDEGLTQPNIDAILSGNKTVEQVIDEQLGIKKTKTGVDAYTMIVLENADGSRSIGFDPRAGPSSTMPVNVGQLSHTQAIDLAREQGIERVNSILKRWKSKETKPPPPAAGATPEIPAPAAEAVSKPIPSGVAASEVPPVISEATTQAAGKQLSPAEQAKLFTPEALQTEPWKTTGLTPRSYGLGEVVNDIKSFFKKHFTIPGHIPKEVWEGPKLAMEGKFAELNQILKHRGREFMNALSNVYGIGAFGRLGGGSRRIPVAAVQLMDDYLKGKVFNSAAIPAEIRGVLDTMRAEITGKSTQIIAMLTAQQNRLKVGSLGWEALNKRIETIKNNLDVYVNRSYEFFDSRSKAGKWYGSLPAGMRMAAEDLLITKSPTPLTRLEAQELLKDWLSDLKTGEGFGGGGKLGSKDLSIFMKRNVIEPEFRAILGEYRDPFVNYAKSVSKMGDWIAKQTFLEETRRIGMGTFLFEEGAPRPASFNTRIAGEGSKTMSPLNGLRTTEEIAAAFDQFYETPTKNIAAKIYYAANAWTKMAATTHSILTQMRNLTSRPIMAMWAGHINPVHAGTAIRAIWNEALGSSKTWQAYTERLARLGVISDTARDGELRAVLKDAELQDVNPASLTSWSLVKALKKVGLEVPRDIYKLSDELGNIFGFENELANQRKIHPTWTPAELDAAAAKVVRDLYPTYSETPAFVKWFRKFPVTGPFVTFSYQVYRTAWNGLARSFYEIRSTNPMERAIGFKRLGSQMAALTLGYAMQEAGKAFWNVSTQQEDDFRRFQPDWNKNAKWLFLDKDSKTGDLRAMNVSYMDPFSLITDPAVAVAAAIRSDKSFLDTFSGMLKETLRSWTSEQMLTQALIEARNGKTDSGREIYNITDTPTEKTGKQLKYVLEKAFYPGTVQRVQRRIIPAARNEQPIFGRKLELGPEIARELSGVAIETTSFKTGLAFRTKDFVEKDRASEGVFHQMVSRSQTTTPEDLVAAFKDSDARRQFVWKEMRKDFLAATRNGVSVNEAKKTMIARGMTNEDATDIAKGRYKPMDISEGSKKRAKERSRELPRQAIQEYQQTVNGMSLDD